MLLHIILLSDVLFVTVTFFRKVWMLTGDKLETATSIAKSSRLVSRSQELHIFESVANRTEARCELNKFRRRNDYALIIRGDALEVIITCLKL